MPLYLSGFSLIYISVFNPLKCSTLFYIWLLLHSYIYIRLLVYFINHIIVFHHLYYEVYEYFIAFNRLTLYILHFCNSFTLFSSYMLDLQLLPFVD